MSRVQRHAAHRAAPVGLVLMGNPVECLSDFCGPHHGIPTKVHRRRSCMSFKPCESQVEPLLPKPTDNNANGGLGIFENGALLDVWLEIGFDLVGGDLITTAIMNCV